MSTISINFIDHILKFCFCGVLSKRSHDCAQLLGSDGAVTILIEEGEGLFEFSNLFFSQLVSLVRVKESSEEERLSRVRDNHKEKKWKLT